MDGEVYGSFVGAFSIADSSKPPTLEACELVSNMGSERKLESITLFEKSKSEVKALVVSDDDSGGSTLAELKIEM